MFVPELAVCKDSSTRFPALRFTEGLSFPDVTSQIVTFQAMS